MKINKGRIKSEDSLINFLPKDQKDFIKKNKSKIDQEVKSSGNLKELLENTKQEKNGKIKNEKRLKKRPSEQALKDKVNNKLKFEIEKMTLSNEINKNNFKEKVESKPICNYKLKNILYQEIPLLSPVYEYYKGIDSLLKEELKEYFNYYKSNNFIKRSYIMENYKDKVENKDDKFGGNNKEAKNEQIKKSEKELNIEFNDINNPKYNNYYIYNNKFEEPIQKKNIQINDYNNYYYDKNNYNNKKEKYYNYNNKYKTGLKIKRSRKNWTCLYCNNYNYYFRNSCYICNALNPNI